MTRVKLCGMWRDEDICAVAAAAPDMVGFVIDFPRSRRSVTPERAWELSRLLDAEPGGAGIERVGVFVDEPAESVALIAEACGLAWVQLHGHEDAAYIECLRGELPRATRVIQAFRVRGSSDVRAAEQSPADLVLLDNGQGTGEAFDWSLVRGVGRPFILAGGLTPDNVAAAIDAVRPWGVDMSSGIETNNIKDASKMAAAVAAAKGGR